MRIVENNGMDFGLAKVSQQDYVKPVIKAMGSVAKYNSILNQQIYTPVRKTGAASLVTYSEYLNKFKVTLNISPYQYSDLAGISPSSPRPRNLSYPVGFSEPGDSGALVFDALSETVYGMVIGGGTPSYTISFIADITKAVQSLNFTFP